MFRYVLSLTFGVVMQPRFIVAGLLIAALCTSASLCASSLLDTFGPANGFSNNLGDNNAFDQSIALPFTPLLSGTVASAQIAASGLRTGGNAIGSIFFDIRSDSGGLPGNTILDSFTFSGVSALPEIFTALSTQRPMLQAGTPYWFVMEPAADPAAFFGIWHTVQVQGCEGFKVGNGGWFVNCGVGVPAARITAIPESRLDLLTALSIAAFAWSRFRSRKLA